MNISQFLSAFSGFVWGVPLMVLLLGTGFYLTWRMKAIQWRGFSHAVNVARGKFDKKDDPGEISHFHALATALSATIGTGNIVGVAAAILTGGPGAVFWMWMTALLGMATKFTCCSLAVKYRDFDKNGEVYGGPMYYIELGMGKKFKWLAVCFAVFTALASFGIGNMFQINNMVSAFHVLINEAGVDVSLHLRWTVGLITAGIVAAVILGGIKRIARVSSKLAPAMCIFYFGAGMLILIKNYTLILPGLALIFQQAFQAPESVAGGLLGGVIRAGVSRGLFSNEVGLGSAPMAHSAARTNEPIREGLVAMLGPFIDTIVVCTITALVIICTGAYETHLVKGELTTVAFEQGLPGFGWIVSLSIILFAFSTLIAWSYYGDRATAYLLGKNSVVYYRLIYVVFVVIGAIRPLDDVINFCDALNGLMAIPNLIALVVLAPVVVGLLNDYFKRMKAEGSLK